jgi:hypothetical protein
MDESINPVILNTNVISEYACMVLSTVNIWKFGKEFLAFFEELNGENYHMEIGTLLSAGMRAAIPTEASLPLSLLEARGSESR